MSLNNLCYGFDQSVERSPESPALTLEGQTYSYGDLSNHVNTVVAKLVASGVTHGDRVGLYFSKSLELYASILAVLKVGAVFVPLEPLYPESRIQHIIEDAELKIILVSSKNSFQSKIAVKLELIQTNDQERVLFSAPGVNKSDLAYILYTSGSTGRPKGVMITHGNVIGFIKWATEFFNYTSVDRVAGHSDLMFDLSIMDTFCSWLSGAHLFPVIDSEKLVCGNFIKKNKISIWFSVPSVLNTMKALGELKNGSLAGLKTMLFCGEPLKAHLARELMQLNSHLRVGNLYGPTEATIACSYFELSEPPEEVATSLSIGWETGNTKIVVVKENKTKAEVGEKGFVYILGEQVGAGYWKNEEETQQRFLPNPLDPESDEPCFFTGDVVKVCEDGPHFVGRNDGQVKVNGFRIELNDIEYSLMKVPSVVEAAVLVHEKRGGGEELIGFIEGAEAPVANEIISILKQDLPNYMIPKKYRYVDTMPRTLNGKLDRKLLVTLL